MSARLTLIGLDARLQFRYGVYFAYLFVVAFYAALLLLAGDWLPGWIIALVIYSDPAVVGFFFLGALMMLEKAEGTRTALATTPVSPSDYLFAKTLTLSLMAVAAVTVIGALAHSGANWPVLIAATVLTSIMYVGIGIPIAMRFKTVTSYLIGSAGLLVPVVVPAALALYDPMPVWAIAVPPASQPKLIMIGLNAGSASATKMVAMFGISILAAAAAVMWATHDLSRELGRK